MSAAIYGLLGLGLAGAAGFAGWEYYQTHKKVVDAATGKDVPPPKQSLDAGMDSYTSAVVSAALKLETNSTILDKLAADLKAAGFPISAQAVATRSSNVKTQTKPATSVTSGVFSVAGEAALVAGDVVVGCGELCERVVTSVGDGVESVGRALWPEW